VPAPAAPVPAATESGSSAGGITASGTSAAASPAATGSAEPAKAAVSARTLVIVAREECWIEVKRGDKPPVTRTIKAGTTETIDGTGGVTILVGNVPGVDVSLGGKPLDLRSKARNNVARVDLK
jgi:cytoskeleton protein RodZ